MPSLLFLVLSLILIANPLEGKWELRKNVYVVDLDMRPGKGGGERVELVCEESTEDVVKWKKGPLSAGQSHSRKLSKMIREFPDAGNYTCHGSDGRILSSYFLYINELYNLRGETGGILKPNKDGQFIECVAKNYNGSFFCSWHPKVQAHHQFSFQAQDGAISCTDPKTNNNGLTFTVICNYTEACPYGEENKHISVFLNATQQKKFSNYSAAFFFKDIIKPDPPENLQKRERSLCWHYPASWSNCHSFFPLEFNVNMTDLDESRKGMQQRKRSTQGDFKNKGNNTLMCDDRPSLPVVRVRRFCVQARDKFQGASWSDWSCTST